MPEFYYHYELDNFSVLHSERYLLQETRWRRVIKAPSAPDQWRKWIDEKSEIIIQGGLSQFAAATMETSGALNSIYTLWKIGS